MSNPIIITYTYNSESLTFKSMKEASDYSGVPTKIMHDRIIDGKDFNGQLFDFATEDAIGVDHEKLLSRRKKAQAKKTHDDAVAYVVALMQEASEIKLLHNIKADEIRLAVNRAVKLAKKGFHLRDAK